jgi:hypothetical protein
MIPFISKIRHRLWPRQPTVPAPTTNMKNPNLPYTNENRLRIIETNRREFLRGLAVVFGAAALPLPIEKVLASAGLPAPEIRRIIFDDVPKDPWFKIGDTANISMGAKGLFTGFFDGQIWWGLLVDGRPLHARDYMLARWEAYNVGKRIG